MVCSLLDKIYSLFHSLYDVHFEGQHPDTENKLILELEGDTPIQDVQDTSVCVCVREREREGGGGGGGGECVCVCECVCVSGVTMQLLVIVPILSN